MPETPEKKRRPGSIRLPVKAARHSTTNFAHFLKNKLKEMLSSADSHTQELHDIEQLISNGNFNESLQALETLEILNAKKMIPIHWGTFKLSLEPLDEPVKLLKELAAKKRLNNRIVILNPGETWSQNQP